ncbi:hypothetical protein E2C01_077437 [Portunus trituberculatus]|uniref:Uncharacterized protein n=1 Tax=Portunus trituberculatus TaxID=210409 RepID=A0A5B7IK97_PORTR|nr:hypothetical protein [Portunus trituberculatus]
MSRRHGNQQGVPLHKHKHPSTLTTTTRTWPPTPLESRPKHHRTSIHKGVAGLGGCGKSRSS